MMTLLFFALSSDTALGSNISKSKKFIKIGMYTSALSVLEEELKVNPDNAEALYLSGICHLQQDRYDEAENFFSDAVNIKSDYRFGIANVYKKTADDFLVKGSLRPGIYKKAVRYVPLMKKEIANHLFNTGRVIANKKDDLFSTVTMEELYALAIELDSDVRLKVATYYFNLSRASDDEHALKAFKKAASYHKMYDSQYENRIVEFGERFLRQAKKLARIPGKEKDTEELKRLAGTILGSQVVLVELPGHRLYDPGEHTFSLRAGEQTDHWIKFTYPNSVTCSLSSRDNNFLLVFDNGDKIKGSPKAFSPLNEKSKFKLQALTDQKNITMTIKMKR